MRVPAGALARPGPVPLLVRATASLPSRTTRATTPAPATITSATGSRQMIRRPPRSTLFPYTRSDLGGRRIIRSEEQTSELQSHSHLVCRLLLVQHIPATFHEQRVRGALLPEVRHRRHRLA